MSFIILRLTILHDDCECEVRKRGEKGARMKKLRRRCRYMYNRCVNIQGKLEMCEYMRKRRKEVKGKVH